MMKLVITYWQGCIGVVGSGWVCVWGVGEVKLGRNIPTTGSAYMVINIWLDIGETRAHFFLVLFCFSGKEK